MKGFDLFDSNIWLHLQKASNDTMRPSEWIAMAQTSKGMKRAIEEKVPWEDIVRQAPFGLWFYGQKRRKIAFDSIRGPCVQGRRCADCFSFYECVPQLWTREKGFGLGLCLECYIKRYKATDLLNESDEYGLRLYSDQVLLVSDDENSEQCVLPQEYRNIPSVPVHLTKPGIATSEGRVVRKKDIDRYRDDLFRVALGRIGYKDTRQIDQMMEGYFWPHFKLKSTRMHFKEFENQIARASLLAYVLTGKPEENGGGSA
jgi:hypothetical protein